MPVTLPARARAGLRVGGLTPFTSIDYPGKLSAVVFVQGCPWRCGYCHNPHLQSRSAAPSRSWTELMAWLQRRAGFIDAVVFSGGEPAIDPALGEAIGDVRALGLSVGLHSAGIYPRRLRALLPRVDWVGLDVKAPLDDDELHDRIAGVPGGARAARDSVRAVIDAGIDYELRTTAHPSWLDDTAVLRLAGGLASQGATHYALQVARPVGSMDAVPADYPALATLARLQDMFERFTLRRD
jgi:anaerobic ribonucleoside-triphosphate reductase activating protein